MKKSIVLFLGAILTLEAVQGLKADTIADWTFQTAASTNALFAGLGTHTSISSIPADFGTGSLSGVHASASTVWSTPAGNGSTNSVSGNNWGINDYYQFQVSTIGFENIVISFDQVGSGTGPRDFNLQYSIDGSTFTTFTSYSLSSSVTSWNVTTPNALSSFSYDLSSVGSLNNASTVFLRLLDADTTSVNGSTVGTAGSDRVDNILIVGSVPEPSAMALATIGGLACFFVVRRRK